MLTKAELLDSFFREGQRRILASEDADGVATWMRREVDRLLAVATPSGVMDVPESVSFYEMMMADREAFYSQPKDEQRRLTFPWRSWNDRIDPLPGGMLMTLAGADGAGKSTYGECIAEWYARLGFKVVYFHFELSHQVMLDRRMARWSGMSIRELKSDMTPEQKKRVRVANQMISEISGNIFYVHCPSATMEGLCRTLTSMTNDKGVEVAIVDYLEKAQPSKTQLAAFGQNTFAREGDNVEQLKSTAERLGIPVIMLAQLNKQGKRAGDELDRTFIRGAGEKTEKANVVVLIRREMDDVTNNYSDIVDVRVDKNTLGEMGSFRQVMVPANFAVKDAYIERVQLPTA